MSTRAHVSSRGFLGQEGFRSRVRNNFHVSRSRVSIRAGLNGRSHTDTSGNNRDDDDRFDLSEMVEFLRDRILGDFRRPTSANGQSRPSSVPVVASGHVDADHKGVISSDVRKTLAYTVTDLDTRDAMEACAGVEGELEKAECFVTFGVSPDADMWYSVVHRFKELLKYDTEPFEESVHAGEER